MQCQSWHEALVPKFIGAISQGFEDKEKERLVQYRHLWAAHLLGVQPQLEDALRALTR